MPDNLGRFEYGGELTDQRTKERRRVIAAVITQANARMLEKFGLALFAEDNEETLAQLGLSRFSRRSASEPGQESAPLWDPAVDIRWGETFAVGDSICVTWVFRGIHVGDPAGAAGEPAGELREQGRGAGFRSEAAERRDRAGREAAVAEGRTFIGERLGTGRPIHVKVISTGEATVENGVLTVATLNYSRWDSLAVLGQMGVQAVGRPIGGARVTR